MEHLKVIPIPGKPEAVEVRCAVRFPLALPIRVITAHGEYEAVTENISASGVLFQLEENIGVGSTVQFLLKIPASALGTQDEVTLHCFGRIVRSYQGTKRRHAAAIIDDYRFSH
jgi:hypothetical protein